MACLNSNLLIYHPLNSICCLKAKAHTPSRAAAICAGSIKGRPKAVAIQTTILRDIYPRQVNQVEVKRGTFARTLRFGGDEVQTVALP